MLNFELLERGDYRLTTDDPTKVIALPLFMVGSEGKIVELYPPSVSLDPKGSDFTPPKDEIKSIITPEKVSVQASRLKPGSKNETELFDSCDHKVEIREVPRADI